MRLIDADVLVEALKSNINNMQRIIDLKFCDGIKDYRDMERKERYGYVLNVINNQPTAYDVDKVIEELRNTAFNHGEKAFFPEYVGMIPLKTAKDIIKRGGVE